jgi:protease-4
MNRSTLLTGLLLAVCSLALVIGVVRLTVGHGAQPEAEDEEMPEFFSDLLPGSPKKEGIAVVNVVGAIQFGADDMGPFSSLEATAEGVARRIRKLRKDDKVKAIVLRVNSPGGTIAASQEIY